MGILEMSNSLMLIRGEVAGISWDLIHGPETLHQIVCSLVGSGGSESDIVGLLPINRASHSPAKDGVLHNEALVWGVGETVLRAAIAIRDTEEQVYLPRDPEL